MNELHLSDSSSDSEIAIIGMAGRFPCAQNISEFWKNLENGIESISFFTDEELLASGEHPDRINDSNYVKAHGILGDIERFDASFFGFTPREAEVMDPQHRLFLETAWESLEHAGYDCERYAGDIGIFAGVGMDLPPLNTYLLKNLVPNFESLEGNQISIANRSDFLATKVSYKLNLTGPSVNVQAACSTSLLAVHLACQSLLNGECDICLAGGVSIQVPQKLGYMYQEGMILSSDGHCRAFDAQAQGIVSGDGTGIVVLKRLADAIADGDYVHAIIKGTAVNNDGSSKMSYVAPSVDGQTVVIREAMAVAEVTPDTVTYVEAHGTGTTIGDPIEIEALTQAFRDGTNKKGFCGIGSVKTNIGHLDRASGVAGLIKTVLALKHKLIPAHLHFEEPNPKIDFANSPFYVNVALSEWKTNGMPRRAGINSFGVGGTNVHAVLEEAPPRQTSSESRLWQLLVLSAKTETALEASTANLIEHLKEQPDGEMSLPDVAYTLQVGRKPFAHRRMLVCHGVGDAVNTLEAGGGKAGISAYHESISQPITFMFPGQGAQYANMGAELYQTEPQFREQVDRCCELLISHLGLDLRKLLYPDEKEIEAATEQLIQTAITQPALFVIEYALAKLWMSWGILPSDMIGHSIGEYVAACLADVFSLEDGLALIVTRGRLMQQLSGGAMLAVPADVASVESLADKNLSLAVINEPSLCVVSGTTEAVDAFEKNLVEKGIACTRLHTSHAFHSEMMDPIIGTFTEMVRQIKLNPPKIPYISNVTGTWITAEEATDATYWARHLRQTVRFAEGVEELLKEPNRALLEVGPGRTLSTLVGRHPDKTAEHAIIPSIRHPRDSQSDVAFLLNALGNLWLVGIEVDWDGFYANEVRHRVPLPTYPFERERYWIEPPVSSPADVPKATHPSLLPKRPDMGSWFYVPSWKRTAIHEYGAESMLMSGQKLQWLVFTDTCGLGDEMVKQLKHSGQEVVTVSAEKQFAKLGDCEYAVGNTPDDYETLIEALVADEKTPDRIVHLWNVSDLPIEDCQQNGFYSLIFLAQVLGKQNTKSSIAVVTNSIHEVTGEEVVCPDKATVLGPCQIIPEEYPNLTCQSIDIVVPDSENWQGEKAKQILAEFDAESTDTIVAYRRNYRWIKTFEPVRLEAKASTRLREGGVYLITGGLGGIGLVLAEYLAQTVQANLVLTSRSGLLPKHQWEDLLATHDETDATSQKIRKVQALEELGSEVLVVSADVANPEQMREVIKQTSERFGEIHGVIHAAGIAGGGIIQLKTPEIAASVLAPKVKGTQVLNALFKDTNLDFMVLCSSIASILGGSGQVDYCGANAFLDASAHCNHAGRFTVSINWDTWSEIGMAVETEVPMAMRTQRENNLKKGLLSKEGMEVFRLILNSTLPQVIVSTRNLLEVIESTNHLAAGLDEPSEGLAEEITAEADLSTQALHARPNLSSKYVAPIGDIEKTIAEIWQTLLGINKVGVNDDFFELGGHSLLATQLLNQLRQSYEAEVTLNSLFDSPTVVGLAKLVDDTVEQEAPPKGIAMTEQLQGASATNRYDLIEGYLKARIAKALDIEVEELPDDGNFEGLDLELIGKNLFWDLRRDLDLSIYAYETQRKSSIGELVEFIVDEFDGLSELMRPKSIALPSRYDHQLTMERSAKMSKDARPARKSMEKNKSMVFVLAPPRSGTTLLRVMLAGHSQLFCPPELRLLGFTSMSGFQAHQMKDPMYPTIRLGVSVTFMELIGGTYEENKAFVEDLADRDVSIQEVYRMIQEKATPRILVDKTPRYTKSLYLLQQAEEMFEAPKYIHLTRHPYAVMESFIRNRFDKHQVEDDEKDSYTLAETYWTRGNTNVLEFAKQLDKERYHRLRYEDLVREPAKTMNNLCEFLGIPFEESVIHPYEGRRMADGPGDPNFFSRDKIDSSLSEAWRNIRLPRLLSEESRRLAAELSYELPHDVDEIIGEIEGVEEDTSDVPVNLDRLSDREVDTLLNEMLAEQGGN